MILIASATRPFLFGQIEFGGLSGREYSYTFPMPPLWCRSSPCPEHSTINRSNRDSCT
jgi:hypothetical protein